MSFFSTLGKVLRSGYQTLTPVGQAWAFTENWLSQPQDSGLVEKFVTAEQQSAHESLSNVGTAVSTPYQYGISRPLTTALIATNKPLNDPTMYQGDTWSTAWGQSKEISPGQALSVDAINWWNQNDNLTFDKAGEEDRKALFEHTWKGRLASGAVDFSLNWFVDPLVLAGKATKLVRTGATLTEGEHVGEALDISRGVTKPAEASRAARAASGNMNRMFAKTDNMSFEELMNLSEFRQTPDASVLAVMFADANRIADKQARWAAKADVFGAAIGDTGSIVRLSTARAEYAEKMRRFVQPVESSNGHLAFSFNDFGMKQIEFFNSPEKLKEVLANQDFIEAEMARLDRLNDIAGTVSHTGVSLGQRAMENLRNDRLRESITFGTPGSRAVRIMSGPLGTAVPGSINVRDVAKGYDQLAAWVARSKWLDPVQRTKYLQDFGAAPDQAARSRVVYRIEEALFRAAGKANGYTEKQIRALHLSTTGVRNKTASAMKSRLYSAAPGSDKIFAYIDDEGMANAVSDPFLRTHFAETIPLSDPRAIDAVIKTDQQTRWLERFAERWHFNQDGATAALNAGNRAADVFDDMATNAMWLWKFSALGRIAYPLRIQVDTQLRMLSALGPMQYMLNAKAGAVNSYTNRAGVLAAIPGGRIANPELEAVTSGLNSEIKSITKRIDSLGEGAEKLRLTRERAALRRDLVKTPMTVTRGKTAEMATVLRQGTKLYKGVPIRSALDPEELAIKFRTLDASGTTALLMSDMTSANTAALRATGGWDVVKGADKNWSTSYLRAVNQQIRNSPTAMEILANPDDASVASFVSHSPEALKEWKAVKDSFESMTDWIAYARYQVNHLLSGDIAQTAITRPLRPSDLKVHFGDVTKRPDVHGEAYSFTKNSPASDMLRGWAEKWYRFASDGPENVMGRHPLYNARFREHMKSQVDRVEEQFLTADRIAKMRKNADALARRDVADTLYDVTKRSNASETFKYMSPFFAAWEDTMLKWGKLFYDNPDQAVRFSQGWQAPNSMGAVVDDQGNFVKGGKTYDAATMKEIKDKNYRGKGEYFILPKWASPGTSGGNISLRKDSFNIVFQGEPWWLPGAGPLVSIPMNEVVKKAFPEHAENPIIAAVLPFGTSNASIADQALPTWITKARDAFSATTNSGAGNDQYAQVYAMFTAQAWADYNNDPTIGKPNADKIANETRNWFILRAVTAQASPVSATPHPKYQLYIDKAHEYQAKYGMGARGANGETLQPSWQEKFYEDFPEYFEMALSLSTNNTGIQASVKAYDASKKFRKEIAANPDLGWMYVGADNVYDFNAGVYNWQKGTPIGYGQQQTFRGQASPADAIAKVRAQKGWIEYNKAMTWVNLELERRGLTSLQQKGAEDLAYAKREWTAQQAARNSDWAQDYYSTDSSKVQTMAQAALDSMRKSPSLANRSDMQSLLRYLDARQWIRSQLAERKSAGGSSSLGNADNYDLDSAWNKYTQSLVKSDIGFEQMYNRVLVHDDMTRDLSLS